MARQHLCDVPGCGAPRRPWMRICERCFHALPGDIRTGLIDAFRQNRKADWRRWKRQAAAYMLFKAPGAAAHETAHPQSPGRGQVTPQQAYANTARLLGED